MKKNVSPAVIVLVVAVVVIVIALLFYKGFSGSAQQSALESLDHSDDVIETTVPDASGGNTPSENPMEEQ